MKSARAVIGGLVIILLVLAIVQNLESLTRPMGLRLNLLLVSLESPSLPTSLVMVICFAAGFFLAFGLGYSRRRQLKKAAARLQAKQAQMDKELCSLRNLPITGDMTADTDSSARNPVG